MDKHNQDVATSGPDLTAPDEGVDENGADYETFGPVSDEEHEALQTRIVELNDAITSGQAQATLIVGSLDEDETMTENEQEITLDELQAEQDADDVEAARAVHDAESLAEEAAKAAREAERKAQAEAEYAERKRQREVDDERRRKADGQFSWELARLLNQQLTKIKYGGKAITGAWAKGDGGVTLTTASKDVVNVGIYGDEFYYWGVGASVLDHARKLGHEPSDFQNTYRIGRVSACERCDATVRITDDDEVLAAAYMARCPRTREPAQTDDNE
jgi:hypothetical protein